MVTLESVCAQTLSAPPTTSGRGNREMSRQLTAQLGVCSPSSTLAASRGSAALRRPGACRRTCGEARPKRGTREPPRPRLPRRCGRRRSDRGPAARGIRPAFPRSSRSETTRRQSGDADSLAVHCAARSRVSPISQACSEPQRSYETVRGWSAFNRASCACSSSTLA